MGQNGWLEWMEWMEGLGWCVPLKDVFHDGVCGHHVAYDIFPFCFFFGGQGGPIIHQLG